MEDITIKEILDSQGDFNHLELWKGKNCIKISLQGTHIDSLYHSYKWANLKDVINKIQERLDRLYGYKDK